MVNCLSCPTAGFADLSAEILRLGKHLRFQAHGNSMQPLVRDGDILLIEPLNGETMKTGEIVLCTTHPGIIVVHRVIRRKFKSNRYSYLVQGDQVGRADGWVAQECIHGRVVKIERETRVIDVFNPVMKILGWFAVIRSRWAFSHNSLSRVIIKLGKKLPGLASYIA